MSKFKKFKLKYISRFSKDIFTNSFWRNVFQKHGNRFMAVSSIVTLFTVYLIHFKLYQWTPLPIMWFILNLAQIYDTYHDIKYK